MRLIDADALKKRIQLAPNKDEETWGELYDRVIFEIDYSPIIEQPDFKAGYKQAILDGKAQYQRPHGKWEEVPVKRDILHPNGIKYVCSACKRDNCYGKPPFCMYCGADMRRGGAE